MGNKEKLEKERSELNTLIGSGITFEVDDTEFKTEKRLFGLFRKRVPVTVRRTFRIEELTLGTLDRLSAEWIEFAIDDAALKSEIGMSHAKTLVHNHALRCAKIVAIAVMGADYLIPKYGGTGVVRYAEDRARMEYLTNLFFRTVKPSGLYRLVVMIDSMGNLGDFINSIRLMSIDRSAMPLRVEGKAEV